MINIILILLLLIIIINYYYWWWLYNYLSILLLLTFIKWIHKVVINLSMYLSIYLIHSQLHIYWYDFRHKRLLHCCMAALLIFNLLFVALNGWRTKKKKKLIGMNKWYTKNNQSCMCIIREGRVVLREIDADIFFLFLFFVKLFLWEDVR